MDILPVFLLYSVMHSGKIAQTGKKICKWQYLTGEKFCFYKKVYFFACKV